MGPLAKAWLTLAIVLLALALCTVGRTRFRRLSNPSYWAGKASDPIQFALFDKNGDIRRIAVLIASTALLALLWLVD